MMKTRYLTVCDYIKPLVLTMMAILMVACEGKHDSEKIVGDMSFSIISEDFDFIHGDKVAVMGAEAPFTVKAEGDDVSIVGDVVLNEEYYSAYPYSALKYFSPTDPVVAVMSIPIVQKAVKNQIPHDLRFSVGTASDQDKCMAFDEKTAYLKFTIVPESGNIRSISVVSDLAPLAGDMSVMCKGVSDVYPMPGSAYNVCLVASGEYFEPGDYYIAVRPTGATDLDVAFEDGNGRIALNSSDVSYCDSGQVIDLGTVSDLVFQSREIIPGTNTLIYQSPKSMTFDISALSNKEVEVTVLEGAEWMSVVQTRAVTSPVFRIALQENAGTTRIGTFEVRSVDGDSRLVYTLVQYGLAGTSDEEAIRNSLSALYESANGNNWINSLNWCTDASLDQWYGLSVNEYGEVTRVSLSYNYLQGTLPEEFGGFAPLAVFALSRNSLDGNIPDYIYAMSSVDLTYNYFESISDVTDPETSLMHALYIYDNQIEGTLPENVALIPNLSLFDARNNKFSGNIPESYGRFFEKGGALRLNGNNLTGQLPESIRNNPEFKTSLWTNILFQNGEGFDFDDIEIYASAKTYDLDSNVHQTSEYLSENEYTLYVDLSTQRTEYDAVLPDICGWSNQYSENGFGVIAYSPKIISYDYDYIMEKYGPQWSFVSGTLANFPNRSVVNMLLLDRNGRVVLNPAKSGMDEILTFLEDKYGPYEGALNPNPPVDDELEDRPEDGLVTVLQTAQEGNGIDIVFMGDGYNAKYIVDGTYEDVMREAMEYFFEIEPFKTYRRLFNVYSVNVVSDSEHALGSYYASGTSIKGDDEKCFEYAAKALGEDRMDEALVITIMNSTEFGGSTYMYPPKTAGDWAGGRSVSYIPKVSLKMDFRGLIQHEACGHGFAKLADEYNSGEGDVIPESEKDVIRSYEKYGWYRNVDFTDDPSVVKWAHLLSGETSEGVYEGALGYASGVWRPSYTSIMKDNKGTFNAPSLEAIEYRINKLAYQTAGQMSKAAAPPLARSS